MHLFIFRQALRCIFNITAFSNQNLSCLQSVTKNLSLGGEVFWAGQHRKSGIGYAARYNTDKMVCHLH